MQWLSSILISLLATTAIATPPRSNVVAPCSVLTWNAHFVAEMKIDTFAPALLARNLAILHTALEKAYLQDADCQERRVHLVSYKVCAALLPTHAHVFERLLTRLYPDAISDADREFADACTIPILETLTKDGSSRHVTYLAKNKPGAWCRTAPFFREAELPHWGGVKPLFLKKSDQFRPLGPPELSSPAYSKAVQEVLEAGGLHSIRRQKDQTEAATFWSDFSYTETPVGHWNSIAREIALQKALSPRACATLFYLLSASLSDTAIACWDAKYAFDFWRPITAIQKADQDNNPETTADPLWAPFLKTPNHPEYVSGHSAFSGAASQMLLLFWGTDDVSFEVQSDTLPGVRRRFTSLKQCALECGESRISGGIHFRFSCEDGYVLGKKVADWVWTQHTSRLK